MTGYKCYTCGLLGDFRTQELELEQCDGNTFTINNDDENQKFSPNGWTWSKEYVVNNCKDRRRRGLLQVADSLPDNFTYVNPCDESIKQTVIDQCQFARNASSFCCNDVIGGNLCDNLQEFCWIDACILADGVEGFIPIYVMQVFTRVVNWLCDIPDIGIQQDPDNLIWYDYEPPTPPPAPTSNKSNETNDAHILLIFHLSSTLFAFCMLFL